MIEISLKNFLNFVCLECAPAMAISRKSLTKFFELILCFIIVERYNELLMKNYETHTVGFAPFPKMIATNYNPRSRKDCGSN